MGCGGVTMVLVAVVLGAWVGWKLTTMSPTTFIKILWWLYSMLAVGILGCCLAESKWRPW